MSFREKIDKIVKYYNISSIHKLELIVGASPASISKYYKHDKEPGRATINRLLSGLNINKEWWDSQKGEMSAPEESIPALKEQIASLKRENALKDKMILLLEDKIKMSGQ